MGTKLYVGNLNYNTTEDSLRQAFGADGREVSSVSIIMDRETGRSRGFAFVEMATEEGAQQALQALDGRELDGRMLRINEAREREARGPRSFNGPPRDGGGPGGGGYRGPGGGGGYSGGGGGGPGGFGGRPAGGGGSAGLARGRRRPQLRSPGAPGRRRAPQAGARARARPRRRRSRREAGASSERRRRRRLVADALPAHLPAPIAAQLPPGARARVVPVGAERMHALEWGPPDGRPIVLVHGNPTWGFLWRKVVAALLARDLGHRYVVPDLIGLGLSSKPADVAAHTLARHAAWLGAFLDELGPGPLVLVAQDWGGPIGLCALASRRARLRGLVLGNTAVGPPAPAFRPTLFHRLSQLPIASDVLFRRLGFPLGVLHLSQGDRRSIRGDVARAYRWPLRHRRDRAAPLALARMVPDSHGHASVSELRTSDELFATADVPIALVWGTRDPILGRVINHLERVRPDAAVRRTEAGHFLQEEVPEPLAEAIAGVAARADWT